MDVRSTFDDVLNTNYVPSQAERHVVERIVSVQDSEIVQLETIVAPILQRLDGLKASSKAHRALLSQARRVPPELVAEIFSWCCVNGGPFCGPLGETHTFCISRPAQILALGQICREWRRIACSTPRIWAELNL
ncbi:hypothetical protein BD410DRAFT_778625, partial [Rickenella mellea]